MPKVQSEVEVVADEKLRKVLIEEMRGPENQSRKNEAFRRYRCLKDRTKDYVIEQMIAQFDTETILEMAYCISNINVAKKVLSKLARVYANGVDRKCKGETQQKVVDDLAKKLEFNTTMKKTNLYLKAQRNVLVGVLPVEQPDEKYCMRLKVYQPFVFDVIPHPNEPERPMFIVLSNFQKKSPIRASVEPAREGRGVQSPQQKAPSDGKDQKISDKAQDELLAAEEWIWWSDSYHFTTDGKGAFKPTGKEKVAGKVEVDEIINPIGKLPFIDFAIDQDGGFWAEGGDDIFDGAILINSMITNVLHVGVSQGYGQMWMSGKDLPRAQKVGPNKAILLEVEDKDTPTPTVGFASASPQLEELKDLITMYVALLLTTNNLSTNAVAADLQAAGDMPSGIALIIDKAESTEDVHDQQQIFLDKEPKIWDLLSLWLAVYKEKDLLEEDLTQLSLPDKVDLELKFGENRPIMSEKEKLENIKLRQELGLNTRLELLKMDDPTLTDEAAQEKLKVLLAEEIEKKAKSLIDGEEEEEDEGTGNPGQLKKDDDKDRPGDQ